MAEIYVHIPFCKAKCRYCDFNSYPACDDATIFSYLAALSKEIKMAGEQYPEMDIATLYIGGGTPSMLDGKRIAGIVRTVREHFKLREDAEITVEANPESLSEDKLKEYRDAGVNRLSIGVQSLNDFNLRSIGRLHDSARALEALETAGKYIDNISADVMIGLPYDNASVIREEIERIAPLVKHMSVYLLTLELNTPLFERVKNGQTMLPNDDELADMQDAAIDTLEKLGFSRYEVSNYAREGYISRHNYGYWTGEEYIGLGAGAHSFIKTHDGKKPLESALRFSSPKDIYAYIGGVNCVNSFNGIPREEINVIDDKELLEETIMLGLRTTRGVKSELVKGKIPSDYERYFTERDGYVSLTREGMAVMNSILIHVLNFE